MFVPTVNGTISVSLPGELLRAKVTRVINPHTVIVEIPQPMMRTHSFRLGDLVACRRTAGVLGETWQALEHRPTLPDLATEPKPVKKPSKTIKKPANRAKR